MGRNLVMDLGESCEPNLTASQQEDTVKHPANDPPNGEDADSEYDVPLCIKKKEKASPVLDDSDTDDERGEDKKETEKGHNSKDASQAATSDDSDEDEGPISLPPKTEKLVMDLGESESCQPNLTASQQEDTVKHPANDPPNFDNSDSEDDVPLFTKKRNKASRVLDDSDTDDERGEDKKETAKEPNFKDVRQAAIDDSDDDDGPTSLPSKSEKPSLLMDNDLYDAETATLDDENETAELSDEDSGDADSDEDEEGPRELSASLKKRLNKGASKKSKPAKKEKPRRPMKEDLCKLHSESQRLVRESEVRLPYHQPQRASLSDFLARTREKQNKLEANKGPSKSWKQIPTALEQQCMKVTAPSTTAAPRLQKAAACPTSEGGRQDAPKTLRQDGLNCEEDMDAVTRNILADIQGCDDADQLPDLVIENAGPDTGDTMSPDVTSGEGDGPNASDDVKEGSAQVPSEAGCSQPGVSAQPPTAGKDQQPPQEGDSGYLTVPNSSSEEENSADSKGVPSAPASAECGVTSAQPPPPAAQPPPSAAQPPPPAAQPPPPAVSPAAHARSALLAGAAVLPTLGFTPKLSGSPDSFIDLDEEDGKKKLVSEEHRSKLDVLMQRVFAHTAKPHKKVARDVELSVVCKEKAEDSGREHLKLQRLTYHVDEEEHDDVTSAAPGSKLVKLKQRLQEKMKEKRCEAREKRHQTYDLDNEEGFEEGDALLDEEAELTDQTDTDAEEEDEEEDGLETYGLHDKQHEDNPFVDGEAEDEDDMDDDGVGADEDDTDECEDDEDALHLELDTKDEEDSASGGRPEGSGDRAVSLPKSQTLELFDEDANTDSPVLSQRSDADTIELCDRPFEQLSGKSANEEPPDWKPSDDKEETSTNTSLFSGRERDASLLSADSSFEMPGSLLPAGQLPIRFCPTSRLHTPSADHHPALQRSAISKSGSSLSGLALPADDSLDLLSCRSPSLSQLGDTPHVTHSGGFRSGVMAEDTTPSQLMDADSLLKTQLSDKKAARRSLMLDPSSQQDASQDDILALCSGRFTDYSGMPSATGPGDRRLFGDSLDLQAATQPESMDELLGLCSGRFATTAAGQSQAGEGQNSSSLPASQPASQQRTAQPSGGLHLDDSPIKMDRGRKRKAVIEDDEDDLDLDAASRDSFGVASDTDVEEDSEKGLSSDEEGDGEEKENTADKFKGFTLKGKRGKFRQDFVDEEAELSGEEELDSDEDLDLAAKDDVMELEEGDLDDVGSEDELRNQVGRIHTKSMIDTDKKELRLFQEMYLPDGDLHSEGAGRMRRFRWSNVDDDSTQPDMFQSDDEDGGAEEEGQGEQQWRVQRYEREKFLQEHKDQAEDLDSNSQLLKLGKVILKQKPTLCQVQPVVQTKENPTGKQSEKPVFKRPLPSHGSFLKRSKETLAKIAEMSKPATNVCGPRNSKNFVFTTVSPEKAKRTAHEKAPQVKRSASVTSQKAAKRPRLERSNTLPQDSIFNLL